MRVVRMSDKETVEDGENENKNESERRDWGKG